MRYSKMTKGDRLAFAGAPRGSKISYKSNGTAYIKTPSGKIFKITERGVQTEVKTVKARKTWKRKPKEEYSLFNPRRWW